MDVALESWVEKTAKKAERFKWCGGLNLLHIKRQVSELLRLIGGGGIFDEYTRHDISHVDEMLNILEWLVPNETKAIMSPADCLMATLGIYFHDLGMLVTRREFDRRNDSGFTEFRDDVLFAGNDGKDYQEEIQHLPNDGRARFLYQEFVRHNHAQRISNWIAGKPADHLGISHEAVTEIDSLLGPLSLQFRRDLAIVCESHHLDDLADIRKYKVSQPYDNSDAQTANLQYAAVLLRTADLLHITSDRTPSIAFRVISPANPTSQAEWAKQMAVTRVRPKPGLDKEGHPDEKEPKDTVDVNAFFTSAEAFFGLTSYLTYVEKQLEKSREWIHVTHHQNLAPHQFPWRWVDDTNVEAEGFLRETFEFKIDQARILDLLTGHTLYNDTSVVIRELVQNSLDAIRLQEHVTPTFRDGHVDIKWDSANRELSVRDNGTGMTQEIISTFLLTVGSSRYQDPEFKKQYPDFSPISKFGIGVLSAFMIADTVEILTCHPDEKDARQLSLRSVHGKYLIRLLDKATDPEVVQLGPHGCLFTLKVRPSADVPDMVKTAKKWIVVPGCKVTLGIDGETPVRVGHDSVGAALRAQLADQGYHIVEGDVPPTDGSDHKAVRVVEDQATDLSVAYALTWDSWFHEWTFLETPHRPGADQSDDWAIGTCVRGIRVESNSPGYTSTYLMAIANAYGHNAPRTNVARYGLDDTTQRDRLLSQIYGVYCKHIAREIDHLRIERSYSLTWATQEGQFMVSPLLGDGHYRNSRPLKSTLMRSAIKAIPLVVVELAGKRFASSIDDLHGHSAFWTTDCALFRSVEWLLRECPVNSSLSIVANAMEYQEIELPKEPLLCSLKSMSRVDQLIHGGREVDCIVTRQRQRRADLRWVAIGDNPRWQTMPESARKLDRERDESHNRRRARGSTLFVPVGAVETRLEDEVGSVILPNRDVLLLPDAGSAVDFLTTLFKQADAGEDPKSAVRCLLGSDLIRSLLGRRRGLLPVESKEDIRRWLGAKDSSWLDFLHQGRANELLDVEELFEMIGNTNWKAFDPSVWVREDDE